MPITPEKIALWICGIIGAVSISVRFYAFVRSKLRESAGTAEVFTLGLTIREAIDRQTSAVNEVQEVIAAIPIKIDAANVFLDTLINGMEEHSKTEPNFKVLHEDLLEHLQIFNKDAWKRHEKQIDALSRIEQSIVALAQANLQFIRLVYGQDNVGEASLGRQEASMREKVDRYTKLYGLTEEEAIRRVKANEVYQVGGGMGDSL